MMILKKHLAPSIAFAILVVAVAQSMPAQQIRIQEGPYYVGEPVTLQVVVKSDGDQKASVKHVGKATGLQVRGPQVQGTSSGTVIVNGRVIQSGTEYVYAFSIVSSESGTKEVGPFEITIDGETTETDSVDFLFERLEDSDDMFLSVETDVDRAFVGQSIPVTVSWGYSSPLAKVRHAFSRLRITSSLFENCELQIPKAQTNETLVLQSGDTAQEVDAKITEEQIDGRNYIVATAEIRAICTKLGPLDIASRCRTQELLSRGGFFESARVRPMVATAKASSIDISPIPPNSPPTFTGAVGENFTISAGLARTGARVGDPVQLTVTLRGDTNVNLLRLPDWSKTPLADQFQFPTEQPAGELAGGGKRFELTIRAKEAGITSLPALDFSWFDPITESFQTSKSKPLPLEISTSDLVSSNNVFSAAARSDAIGSQAASPAISNQESTLAANLAIDSSSGALSATRSPVSPIVVKSLYATSLGLVALAFLWRSRRALSPREKNAVSAYRRLSSTLASVSNLAPADAAKQLSGSLREILQAGETSPSARREIDSLISQCDDIAFSPAPESQADKLNALLAQAKQIASAAK